MGPQKLYKSSLARTKKLFASESGLMVEGLALSGSGFHELSFVQWSARRQVRDGTFEIGVFAVLICRISKLGRRFKFDENFLNNLRLNFFPCYKEENNSNSFDDISFASKTKFTAFRFSMWKSRREFRPNMSTFMWKSIKVVFILLFAENIAALLRYVFSSPVPFFTYGRRHIWASDYEL